MVGLSPQALVSHESILRDTLMYQPGSQQKVEATLNWQEIRGEFNKKVTYKREVRIYRNC